MSGVITVPFLRHECSFLAVYRQQIRHHLPRHGKCRAIRIPFQLFPLIDQGELMAASGPKFCGFYQVVLYVFVALLGKGRSHDLVG
jgi:hypothetical protein